MAVILDSTKNWNLPKNVGCNIFISVERLKALYSTSCLKRGRKTDHNTRKRFVDFT